MILWLLQNAGTLFVSLVLAAIVCAIVAKLAKDRKAGVHACGCGCSHCAMAGACHKKT